MFVTLVFYAWFGLFKVILDIFRVKHETWLVI